MESRESSTGTEQKLSGPWAQRSYWSLLGYCSLPASSLAIRFPHIASPASKSQSPQWQPLETMAAAAYPRRGVGLTPQGSGRPS